MGELNEKRKIVSHASSAISLSLEDLAQLQEYEVTLAEKISGRASTSDGEAVAGDEGQLVTVHQSCSRPVQS